MWVRNVVALGENAWAGCMVPSPSCRWSGAAGDILADIQPPPRSRPGSTSRRRQARERRYRAPDRCGRCMAAAFQAIDTLTKQTR